MINEKEIELVHTKLNFSPCYEKRIKSLYKDFNFSPLFKMSSEQAISEIEDTLPPYLYVYNISFEEFNRKIKEIKEFWVINDFFATILREHGEIILEWRTCVIANIYKELNLWCRFYPMEEDEELKRFIDGEKIFYEGKN